MTPKIAASHVEFWKIMQTVTQSPPYRHQRVRVTYWSRFSFVRSAFGRREREDVREENRRLKIVLANLCKRNLIKAEKAAKNDKESLCLMDTRHSDACNMGQGEVGMVSSERATATVHKSSCIDLRAAPRC